MHELESELDLDALCASMHLACQPIVHARNPSCVAFYEALMRIGPEHHCTDNLAWVIAHLSQTRGLTDVDFTVLDLAVDAINALPTPAMTVNVSQETIAEAGAAYIEKARALNHGADRFLLEITESNCVRFPAQLKSFIEQAQANGMQVAIDDASNAHEFGDPAMIRYLAPDVVKVCGKYTRRVAAGGDERHYNEIIRAARSVGAEIVIEWIDSTLVRDFAMQYQPDYFQGWLYGRPERMVNTARLSEQFSIDQSSMPYRPSKLR